MKIPPSSSFDWPTYRGSLQRNLSIAQDLETHVQQLGPPLFQLGVAEVLETLERAEAIVAKVTRFTHEVATPLPAAAPTPASEPTSEQIWYGQALDADEKLRIPAGLR